MPAIPLVIEDDGYLDLTLNVAGASSTVRIDVFDVYNRMLDAWNDAKKDERPAHDQTAAMGRVLTEAGCPAVSHRAIQQVFEKLSEVVGSTLGKGESASESAAPAGTTATR